MLTKRSLITILISVCLTLLGIGVLLPGQVRAETGPAPALMVQTLPPNEDGSITHVIQYGDTLVDIAQAYGISLQDLYDRNRTLDPASPSYFEGQILVIRPAFTETPYITQTYTPPPPTRTPLPTRTPRPTYTASPIRTPLPTFTATPEPLVRIPTLDDLGSNRNLIAYTFIGVSVVGLVALLVSMLVSKNR